MVTKPSAADVRIIITTEMTDEQILAIVDDAALLAARCLSVLESDLQKAIIKYLTAHIIVQSPNGPGGGGQLTSSSLGDASDTYASGQFGKGLSASSYGQMAIALDPNGCLVDIGKSRIGFATISKRHNNWRGG